MVRDTDAQLAKWGREKVTYYSANYYPIDLDVNANFVIFQGILGGDMTVDQAAADLPGGHHQVAQRARARPRELQGLAEGLPQV